MSNRRFDLAVLDMAGTTVSDGGLIVNAITDAIATVAPGQAIDLAEIARLRGAAKQDMFATLTPDHVNEAIDAFNGSLLTLVADGLVKPVPGAESTIRSLREQGIGVCLTTGLDRSVVDTILEHLDWVGLPNQVLTAAEAGRGRPHPDLVLAAARHAGVASMDQIVICGDTVNDLLTGASAGVGLLVGVLTGAHDRDTLQTVADAIVIDSIADLPSLLASA